ncbi:stalk domain-containing protein [Paenibacillus sp. FSL H8-0537]|uniref:stalk domain-containing protein n=1 Tax=Paenibacillus sp. FSL H8-0537 TaxID=2921399 RepID=UPI003100AD94
MKLFNTKTSRKSNKSGEAWRGLLALTLLAAIVWTGGPHSAAIASGKQAASQLQEQGQEQAAEAVSKSFTQIEAAHNYTIALRSDGTVWAWGRNLWGELGLEGNPGFRNTVAPVRYAGLSDIVYIHINKSDQNYMAVKADGTVWTWGHNDSSGKDANGLRQVAGAAGVAKVAGGYGYDIALLKNGTVSTWTKQQADTGKLSFGKPAAVKGLNQVVQVAYGYPKAYAVKKDGTVWSWQPVAAPREGVETIKPTAPAKRSGLSGITSIVAYSGGMMALDTKGKAWSIAENGKKQALYPILTLKEISGSAGSLLLLTTGGEVFAYGQTATGKQGKVRGLTRIKHIAAGEDHGVAIDEDGKAWGWGHNKFYEAGGPSVRSDGMVYTPMLARPAVDTIINGQWLSSIYPTLPQGETVYVPIKDAAKALGMTMNAVLNNEGFRIYTLKYKERFATFRIGDTQAKAGNVTFELPEAPIVYSGATAVPYQLLEQGLGLTVQWNEQLSQLTISD